MFLFNLNRNNKPIIAITPVIIKTNSNPIFVANNAPIAAVNAVPIPTLEE